jgi:hypothetical protein
MPIETQRMSIPTPMEFEDPWFATFTQMMSAVDSHLFASFEDRNLFVMSGGTFAWDATTSTLTWDAAIEFSTPSTGVLQSLAAGTVEIANGEMWVVDLTRGASDTVTLADTIGVQVDPADAVIAIAIRRGDKLYFRNGRVLDDDNSDEVFEGVVLSGTAVKPTDREDQYTGDGSTAAFTLSFTKHANCIPHVFKDGLLQPTADYAIAGVTLTFVSPPLVGEEIDVRYWT